jgi:hypothetical protein
MWKHAHQNSALGGTRQSRPVAVVDEQIEIELTQLFVIVLEHCCRGVAAQFLKERREACGTSQWDHLNAAEIDREKLFQTGNIDRFTAKKRNVVLATQVFSQDQR